MKTVGAGELPLSDVVSATVVRNPWSYGWGIRATPDGMLYNVGGLDAVEVRTLGRRVRLGSVALYYATLIAPLARRVSAGDADPKLS